MTKTDVTDKLIQLVGIELSDVDPETRRLAEQVVEMELQNPNRQSIEEWAETMSKYLCGTQYKKEEK